MQNKRKENVQTKYPQAKPSLSPRKRVGKMTQEKKSKNKKISKQRSPQLLKHIET